MSSNLSTLSASSSCRFQAVAASVSSLYVRSTTELCFSTFAESPSILVSSTDNLLLIATYVPHAASTADITAEAIGTTSVDISSSITHCSFLVSVSYPHSDTCVISNCVPGLPLTDVPEGLIAKR